MEPIGAHMTGNQLLHCGPDVGCFLSHLIFSCLWLLAEGQLTQVTIQTVQTAEVKVSVTGLPSGSHDRPQLEVLGCCLYLGPTGYM